MAFIVDKKTGCTLFSCYDCLSSWVQGTGVEEKVSLSQYMVVYQYGSAVLFNMEEHEVEFYLGIIKKHASGLLHEMRKDGQCLYGPSHLLSIFPCKIGFYEPSHAYFFHFLFYLFILYY